MSMLKTNHIRLKYQSLGSLTLSNDIKEELLSGASYLTNNFHVLLLDTTLYEQGLSTNSSFKLMFDPCSLSQVRYITPSPFHIKTLNNSRMDWKTFKYSPESENYMTFACGIIFGNVTNSLLAKYDPAIHHDTMLADFLSCAFVAAMQGDYQSSSMYMASTDMMIKMIEHLDDADFMASGTSANDSKITAYKL